MGKDSFYVTTPIYYVNDKPHIGHAYTTLLADILSRYHRLLEYPTFFLTGTDEHGQKVQKAAEANAMTPQEQADSTVVRFQELWEKLEITNDDFIRTTEPRHKTIVQKILQDLYDRDLIYRAEYIGHYCIHCERFFTEKDLVDGKLCPEKGCARETQEIHESNYFFRMSQYQDWLIDHIKKHPEFIQPAFRANETLGFLRKPLEDLCISRPKNRLAWGIELPFDTEYVCYVWFDALVNYISAIGYASDDAKFAKWWPASYHLIGKDILTTHTVYWPTMLKAMGVEQAKTIFAHGWWLVGANKMGKSLGNVVNPMDMAENYGVDPFRYFLAAEMTLGQDASFTETGFISRYNSDLANDLGNLSSRVIKFIARQPEAKIPSPGPMTDLENKLRNEALAAVDAMAEAIRDMRLERGIEQVMGLVRAGNRYLEQTAPWKLAKSSEAEDAIRLATVLYTSAEALRIVSGLLFPVMPGKMCELRRSLGLNEPEKVDISSLRKWGFMPAGNAVNDLGPLFPRIKVEEKPVEKKVIEKMDLITIDDFFRSQLKTAEILAAEKVEGADKLLKLRISLGDEERQIVAGIAQHYTTEELVGKTIVVVANLEPAKIRGIESNGMLLAAKKGGKLHLLSVDGEPGGGLSVG